MNVKCLNCGKNFEVNPSNKKSMKRKFCSNSCSASFNNKLRGGVSDEAKKNLSVKMKRIWEEKIENIGVDNWSKKIGEGTKGKFNTNIKSIFEISNRTRQKLIKRLKLKCVNCGWDKTTCDIHHIDGRKIDDYNNHKNLTYLCPNCHRMVHEGLLEKNKLQTFNDILPNNWLDFYYG